MRSSMGYACYPRDSSSVESLLLAAENALAQAKDHANEPARFAGPTDRILTPRNAALALTGTLLVAVAAIAFSGKAVIIKLAYRYGVDAVTLLALRMLFSAPFFALLGWWAARRRTFNRSSARDLRHDAWALGLVGYYLASYFDFLGLQYVTAALERLLLFIHPRSSCSFSAVLFSRRITGARHVRDRGSPTSGSRSHSGNDVAHAAGQRGAGLVLGAAIGALLRGVSHRQRADRASRGQRCRFATYAGLRSASVAVVTHFLVTRDGGLVCAQPAMPVYWLALLMAAVSTVLPIVLTIGRHPSRGRKPRVDRGVRGTARDHRAGRGIPGRGDHRGTSWWAPLAGAIPASSLISLAKGK